MTGIKGMALAASLTLVVSMTAWAGGSKECAAAQGLKVSAKAQTECATKCDKAKTSQVAAKAKSDCATKCDKAKTSQVAAKGKSECATKCDKAKTSQVAAKGKSECATKCDKAKTSQVAAKGKTQCETQCDSKGSKVAGKKGCPIDAAMAKLPAMTYQVGDKKTSCSKHAATLAKETGKPVMPVVAGKAYKTQAEAKVAHVKAVESYVAAFGSVKSCEASGNNYVGTEAYKCATSAGKLAKNMDAAMKKVAMEYKVGAKTTHCKATAGKLAKEGDHKIEFKVGKEVTACNLTARMNLARAKYAAAMKVMLAEQTKKASEKTASSL